MSAQEASDEALASHPIVGAWMVTTPIGPSLAVFSPDGINVQGISTTQVGAGAVNYISAQVGTWQPDGDRRIHFTSVQLLSDVNGVFTGSVTVDGHPRVSEDGQTIIDDAPETMVTVRDATNAVVSVAGGDGTLPPATGVRMGVGSPGFIEATEGTPGAGTPVS